MSLDYGEPTPSEDFVIGALIPLGIAVGPESDEETALPRFVVTALPGHSNKHFDYPIVSVHTLASTRDEADQWARKGHKVLESMTPGDKVTLADGTVVPGAKCCPQGRPAYANYRDPSIKRYSCRYKPELRYLPTK
jgi:hypothetical protein